MLSSGDDDQAKSGLQRACEILENGQAFLDTRFLSLGLHAHLASPAIKVRRWAYKLVALLRDASFIPQLEYALGDGEQDPENRSWASAAFSAVADEGKRARLIVKLGDSYRGTSLELAAKLYARGEPARDDLDLKTWESEPLARKWLCLLCGYAGSESRTIDRRFGDLDLVRNSVNDADPEIVEYSIWAEHKHPRGSCRHIRRKVDDLVGQDNVRRWVYRLLTKDEAVAREYLDLLTDAMDATHDSSDVAREGLALGLATLHLPDGRDDTVGWFQTEPKQRVKLALVDHLALRATRHDDFVARDVLTAEYHRLGPDDLLSVKILSVAKPDWGLVQPNIVASRWTAKGPSQSDLFTPPPVTYIEKLEVVVGNKIDQSGSGNSIMGNALGDMFESSIHALSNQRDQSFGEVTPLIESFLRQLEASNVNADDKEVAVKAASEVTAATIEEKKGKLSTLKGVVRGMLSLPGATAQLIDDGRHLVDAISGALT